MMTVKRTFRAKTISKSIFKHPIRALSKSARRGDAEKLSAQSPTLKGMPSPNTSNVLPEEMTINYCNNAFGWQQFLSVVNFYISF